MADFEDNDALGSGTGDSTAPSSRDTASTADGGSTAIYGEENEKGPMAMGVYDYNDADRPFKIKSNKERVEAIVPWFSKEWFKRYVTHRVNGLVFLTLAGIVIGLLSQAIDTIVEYMRQGHFFITNQCDWWALRYFVYMWYLLAFLWLSAFAVGRISPAAIGSGLPEMKVLLSGCVMPQFLTFRTLVAKVFGLISALGAGMSIGKLGPMGHIGPLVANNMMKIPWVFQKLRQNQSLRLMMLEAAVAMGVAAHFGCPIGGLLFSIEVTSTYYPVRNYWFSIYGAFWAAFSSRMIFIVRKDLPIFNAITQVNYDTAVVLKALDELELVTAMAIGVFCGILGAAFTQIHVWIVYTRRLLAKTNFPLFTSKYPYLFIVGVLTATITFPDLIGDFMPLTAGQILKDMTSGGPLDNPLLFGKDYTNLSKYISLPLLISGRFIVTVMTASVAIPAGLFAPALIYGAGIGRFMGELCNKNLNRIPQLPGIYAFFGAAAMTSGLTQAFSSAVIVMELTGTIFHLIPTLIATLTAIAVSRKLSYNIYDGILISRKLPYLPDITHQATFELIAADVMVPDVLAKTKSGYVTTNIHYDELMKKMNDKDYPYDEFAIVDDEEDPVVRGVVSRAHLNQIVAKHRKKKLGEKWPQEAVQTVTKNVGTVLHQFFLGTPLAPRQFTDEEKKQFADYMTITTDFNTANIHPNMPIDLVHKLFIIFRLTTCFVTKNGNIVGVITRERLRRTVQPQRRFYEYDPSVPNPK